MSFGMVLAFIFVIFIFIKTSSYGIWTWKHENRLGAVMVFFLALITVIIPAYTLIKNG